MIELLLVGGGATQGRGGRALGKGRLHANSQPVFLLLANLHLN